MEVLLEPLNVGPELDTITEESLEGSGYSRRSSGSRRKSSDRVKDPKSHKTDDISGGGPSIKEPSKRDEHSAIQDNTNQGKDESSYQKSSDRERWNKSESSMPDDSSANSELTSEIPAENDDESVSERNSRKLDDRWKYSYFWAHCIYVQHNVLPCHLNV